MEHQPGVSFICGGSSGGGDPGPESRARPGVTVWCPSPPPGTAPALGPPHPRPPHDGGSSGRPGERRAGRRRQGQRGEGGGEAGTQQEPSRHTHRRTPRKLAAASGGTGLRWPPPQGAQCCPAGARCLPSPSNPITALLPTPSPTSAAGAGTAWHGALPAAGLEPVARGVSPHRRGGG